MLNMLRVFDFLFSNEAQTISIYDKVNNENRW